MDWRLQLTHDSGVPLYRQLYEQIAALIRTGRVAAGERLPATRELAGLLGLNRATISSAYEMLEADHLISGQVGRGSFVTGEGGEAKAGPAWNRRDGEGQSHSAKQGTRPARPNRPPAGRRRCGGRMFPRLPLGRRTGLRSASR